MGEQDALVHCASEEQSPLYFLLLVFVFQVFEKLATRIPCPSSTMQLKVA
jgi:hypothetical protein